MSVNHKTTAVMKKKLNFFVLATMILVTVYVGYTMYNVAIAESEKYQALANAQQFRSTTVKANRGTIYDRNGQVLAQSVTVYTVFVDPMTYKSRDTEQEDFIVLTLSETFNVTPESVREKLYKNNAYQVVAKEVEKEVATALMEKMAEKGITSVGANPTAKRYYPQNTLASNVIGHLHYDGYGIYGLEAYYDEYLTGLDGKIITARDAQGAEFQYKYKLSYGAQDCNDIYTNLDATIQYYLEKALETAVTSNNAKIGTATVMNAKTGQIYGMASLPTYNNNYPTEIITEAYLSLLSGIDKTEDEALYNATLSASWNGQWQNKAISSLYFPGSVFKVVTGSAALEEKAIKVSSTFNCTGSVVVADRDFHCWTTHGSHGVQNFIQAMTNSCNPAFVAIGQKLGAESFSRYFEAYGLTEKTGIDLPAEATSIYAPYSRMTQVTLASSSFGQTNKITPIQMLCAYAAVINGGELVTPYIVDRIVDENGSIVKQFEPTIKRQVISEETSQTMRETLETVVTVNSGSNAYIKGYRIGGKSGTSQKLDENPEGDTYVSSYCAFYPAEDPEIIMLVTVDEPSNGLYYGSAVAAPVVSETLSEILPYLGYYAEYTEEELKDLEVTVPDILGKDIATAESTLKSLGLNVKVIGSGEAVVRQVPARGSQMPKDCTVLLYTEEDAEEKMVYVPDLTGYSLSKANKTLASLGLNLRPQGGAAKKAGAECSGVMNYKECYVPVGTIIEAYFIVNDETG